MTQNKWFPNREIPHSIMIKIVKVGAANTPSFYSNPDIVLSDAGYFLFENFYRTFTSEYCSTH
jgi:hypothetical protein